MIGDTNLAFPISAEGIRGDRSQIPDREGEDDASVQNEDIRAGQDSGQVPLLVLLEAAEEVQEVHGRDRASEADPREDPHQDQELWHLVALRFQIWHPQHVQRVS